jgi:hypothetical protein
MQLLEGPAVSVRRTFERVTEDQRHSNVRLIGVCQAPKRLFRDWNMSHGEVTSHAPDFGTIDESGAMNVFTASRLSPWPNAIPVATFEAAP